MSSRGKYLVELALANEQCDTKKLTETLENQNPSENTQKNVDDDDDNDKNGPEFLMLNSALSQDCLFANDIVDYGMGLNVEYCVNTDVLPPDSTIQSNNIHTNIQTVHNEKLKAQKKKS